METRGSPPDSASSRKNPRRVESPENLRRNTGCVCKFSLIQFDASMNNFTGNLPASLAGLHLQSLNVNDNQLEDEILAVLSSNPMLISKSRNITKLVISDNGFPGEIPAVSITYRRSLRWTFGDNQFSGGLPACLTNLKNLEKLNLESNNFTGEIPNDLSSWSGLSSLNLSNNLFIGEILNQNQVLFVVSKKQRVVAAVGEVNGGGSCAAGAAAISSAVAFCGLAAVVELTATAVEFMWWSRWLAPAATGCVFVTTTVVTGCTGGVAAVERRWWRIEPLLLSLLIDLAAAVVTVAVAAPAAEAVHRCGTPPPLN
ncbi:hypothetical protein OSB04_019169 [Centaurea solstitialis]|uniref:Uncharacterized protein n=1 Tax=Centaurea solstitialis TaxID=347529 RepID=A0AA38T1B3_9ASTR|nr:hypothetical protein OSB04_019169 [Centaurea solstitialis]